MNFDLLYGKTRLLVFVEHPINEVFGLSRHDPPQVIRECQLLLYYILRGVSFVVGEEGQPEGEHDVDDDAEGPNVGHLGVRVIQDDLR